MGLGLLIVEIHIRVNGRMVNLMDLGFIFGRMGSSTRESLKTVILVGRELNFRRMEWSIQDSGRIGIMGPDGLFFLIWIQFKDLFDGGECAEVEDVSIVLLHTTRSEMM
jgi:hypothetical protein